MHGLIRGFITCKATVVLTSKNGRAHVFYFICFILFFPSLLEGVKICKLELLKHLILRKNTKLVLILKQTEVKNL